MRIVFEDEHLDLEQPIWRYFKTERFLDFVKTGYIYFAAARQFQDPFEGAVAVMPPGFPVDPRYAELEHSRNCGA